MSSEQIHKVRWRLLAVWVTVFTVATGWALREQREQSKSGRDAKIVLCALKHDLSLRIDSGVSFLKTHPEGLPGVPASTIRNSLRNQQQTLAALGVLRCG